MPNNTHYSQAKETITNIVLACQSTDNVNIGDMKAIIFVVCGLLDKLATKEPESEVDGD